MGENQRYWKTLMPSDQCLVPTPRRATLLALSYLVYAMFTLLVKGLEVSV